MGEITLAERIAELMAEHGGLRATSRKMKINVSYLSRLRNGHQSNPSPEMLKKLGLDRRISYVRRKPRGKLR